MYKIGVIGDYDSICGFAAMGFDIVSVDSVEQAGNEMKNLTSGGYGILFITEPYMEALAFDCAVYNESALLCIIPIPASTGVTGFGESRLKRFVEQAVGSDIIFGEQYDESK